MLVTVRQVVTGEGRGLGVLTRPRLATKEGGRCRWCVFVGRRFIPGANEDAESTGEDFGCCFMCSVSAEALKSTSRAVPRQIVSHVVVPCSDESRQ